MWAKNIEKKVLELEHKVDQLMDYKQKKIKMYKILFIYTLGIIIFYFLFSSYLMEIIIENFKNENFVNFYDEYTNLMWVSFFKSYKWLMENSFFIIISLLFIILLSIFSISWLDKRKYI